MLIVTGVTGDTSRFCILETFCNVALVARGNGVLADQWECAEIVIEIDIVVPASFIVTVLTVFTLLAVVWVIEFVAT